MCGLRSWRDSLLPSRLDFQMTKLTFSIFIFLYFSSFDFFIEKQEMWGNVYVLTARTVLQHDYDEWKILDLQRATIQALTIPSTKFAKQAEKSVFCLPCQDLTVNIKMLDKSLCCLLLVKSKTGISWSIENYSFLINNLPSMKYI